MKALLIFLPALFLTAAQARVVEYNLEVAEQAWSPEPGIKTVRALTLNGGVPGPTLRFHEGDIARIHVHNSLKHDETSIHWHGVLVPNAQDGVPYLTTPPIKAGTTHTFEFPLKHSGTYWYHSHTGLQEQQGVYGSIVIEPKGGEPVHAAREQVVVLSDWTTENPHEVMRTLMRGSDWYAIRKGSAQSLTGAARAGAMKDFWERERMRMPAMDISDVAYDAFLANGKRAIQVPGKPGERVRLRFINSAASTYFYLESATGPMTIVAADGPAVKPLSVKRLLVGMAETYDVIVRVPESGQWEVRATSQDGSGHASVLLGSGELHAAPEIPRPDLYRMDYMTAGLNDMDDGMDMEGMNHSAMSMQGMDMGGMKGMDHGKMDMGGNESERPLAPYSKLHATKSTAYDSSHPRRTIPLRLTGDMERYIWSFNGKTMAEDGVIKIKRGEVLRLEMVNDTMMHHPIHLHGHFFRVLEGQGSDAPLKHTIDVPPMGKRTIEFEADESGDWLFHCHLLYHMHAGMARVFSYEEQGPEHMPQMGEHAEDPFYAMIDGSVQSHMSMGMLTFMNSHNDFFGTWDVGYGHHEEDETMYEIEAGWKRYFNPNFSTVLGYRFTNMEDEEDRAFAGFQYRLPYLVWSSVQFDTAGDLRLGLAKSLQITDRLGVFGEARYDTGSEWEWTLGAEYTLTKQFSLVTQYHSDHGFGAGFGFHF
ncbi:multicopper oxidase domain-containing protein [Haloferula sp. BvORR071]|uniref:multicopper oxidase domain-containing protein n=1 Tax=Haloferula sp. BvORR071 TaxID=1396141 RepID=UPI0006975E09|nr:multicopper oxidase domain-containing protein [Haloferula sp. BvORR071]